MPSRQAQAQPPDRLTAVLGEVDRARRDGWTPQEPVDRARRGRLSTSRREPEDDGADVELGARHLRRRPDDRVRPHTPLVRPPRTLQDAVVAPGRLAVVAVLVLVLTAAAVLGGRLLWLRSTSSPQQLTAPVAESTNSTALQGTPRASTSAAGASSTPRPAGPAQPTQLVVHVIGQVNRPGVVTLRPGARVRDAVAAAGGSRSTADLARVNLARPVADGEQVLVPRPGEPLPSPTAPGPVASGAPSSAGATGAGGAPVNLNDADVTALDTLPGIGPVLAQRILDWRSTHGRFTSVDELGEVSGIGDKLLAQLRPLVTL